jgi:hypothetical protein
MLFLEHELVATHPRAHRPGQRFTNPDHLPPAKLAGLMATPATCLSRATEIGPACLDLIGRLLGERPLDRLRTTQGILKLAHKYSPRRLEAACSRALRFEEISYTGLKRILEQRLDFEPLPQEPRPLPLVRPLYARPVTDFFPA